VFEFAVGCKKMHASLTMYFPAIALHTLQVVQVFMYILTPLMACELDQVKQQHGQQQQQHRELCISAIEAAAAAKPAGGDASEATAKDGIMSGWQLRLIMEYCDQVRAQASVWGLCEGHST
jgi:hypothetical protein